ncbi:P27 family phage terminase small subunit [Allomesorhizobium alhagi]|uniref:P27 family phage terminase small subunit n=1 Tax=Mesorhizobium alhagi CCNWXJ12-2 TaxID=1107882 RepID=H0HR50_9HYPH|nr:P27 family phage terminase small subunit [Mesorhizobium alhagi]EHK56830.1 hypothetical protein MAXJ12_13166 [Mesorhizobium alhagi CCNWXJ12-2]
MSSNAIQSIEGVPNEPDWASLFAETADAEAAHEQWAVVCRELRDAGTLAVSNGHAIKRLVEFRVQFERASRHVAEHGPIITAKRAKIGQWNPHWSVMRQADEAIRAIESELGISPARRGKVTKVARGKKTSRAADAYLKPASD